MASPKTPKQVVIIGSGVIGLTCAYELSSKYSPAEVNITIIARDMPDDSLDSTGWASPWAGANWYPFLNRDPENRWERVSFGRYKRDVPSDIVMDLPIKLYTSEPEKAKDIWYHDIVGKFQPIAKPYPASIGSTPMTASAFEFVSISINVPRFLPWLQDQLKQRGVKFVKGWVSSVADLEYVPTQGRNAPQRLKTDVIVNASGLGAKCIVGIADPLVRPIRGQTVLVRAPKIDWCLMGLSFYVNPETSESTYFIPRTNGDVVLGGTFQADNWDVSPDPAIARGILERCLTYCPELATQPPSTPGSPTTTPDISTIKVLRHNVGLRPARIGGARVEKEVITFPTSASSGWSTADLAPVPNALDGAQSVPDAENRDARDVKTFKVVHAYGVGPAGYQECWGVAEDVCKLVGELLE
ncbi:hypothetical protein FRB90_000983 [Tulasnella sp. 427]|nr:hypothetical protein FRB90_000983 [Tulasnella sp. 427]